MEGTAARVQWSGNVWHYTMTAANDESQFPWRRAQTARERTLAHARYSCFASLQVKVVSRSCCAPGSIRARQGGKFIVMGVEVCGLGRR